MLTLAAHILKKETLLQGKRYCIMKQRFPWKVIFVLKLRKIVERPIVNLSGTHDYDYCFSHGPTDGFKCEIQNVKFREAVCCLEMQETKSLSSSQHFPSTKG